MTPYAQVRCGLCGAIMSYSISIFGKRREAPRCKNWVCSGNFYPPDEQTVKSARQFLRWWKKLEPSDEPIPASPA